MSLSKKSNDEIKQLLDEHGIKHGPVVDSTRKQYEKKLEKAMEKSSDKTYYREEEETTYITYRTPIREDDYVDKVIQRGTIDQDDDKKPDQDTEPEIQFRRRTVNHSVVQSSVQFKRQVIKSGGSKWKVIGVLLLLAAFAAGFYYAYFHLL